MGQKGGVEKQRTPPAPPLLAERGGGQAAFAPRWGHGTTDGHTGTQWHSGRPAHKRAVLPLPSSLAGEKPPPGLGPAAHGQALTEGLAAQKDRPPLQPSLGVKFRQGPCWGHQSGPSAGNGLKMLPKYSPESPRGAPAWAARRRPQPRGSARPLRLEKGILPHV